MGRFIITLLLILPLCAQAVVYKSIDRQGHVIFSDTPQRGSKPVKIQTPQTYTPPPSPLATTTPTPTSQQDEQAVGPFKYHTFAISFPIQNDTLRDNSGNMTVNINLVPPLRSGDKVQLEMNGKKLGFPQATTVFSLTNVDRGTHNIQAKIIDKNGKAIGKSGAVIFHMHQARITPIGIRSEILRESLRAQSPHSEGGSAGPLMMGAPSQSPVALGALPKSAGAALAKSALSATQKKINETNIDKIIEVYREAKLRREVAQNRAIFLQGQEPDLKMQGALPNPHAQVQGALPRQAHYAPLMQGQTPNIEIQGSLRGRPQHHGLLLATPKS